MNKVMRCAVMWAAVAAVAACGGSGGSPGGVPASPPQEGPSAPPPPPPPSDDPDVGDPGPGDGNPPPAPPPLNEGPATPIMFVSQPARVGTDFAEVTGTFGNHLAHQARRGGDLWIAYPPKNAGSAYTLRNLTREAGYGMNGNQPNTSTDCVPSAGKKNLVAVREPAVSWDGQEALVAMTTGCGASQRWQIYRVSNIAEGSAVAQFTWVEGQPPNYNNLSPTYSSHAIPRIAFTTDMPRGGPDSKFAHLKCLDEYEEFPSTCGLWEINPSQGNALTLLHHAPSGVFTPSVDSAGRYVFTQWDHQDDDQQESSEKKGSLWNYASEDDATTRARYTAANNFFDSVFPEFNDKGKVQPGFSNHIMKVFFPWEINQDGTGAETLNHIGRHELRRYAPPSRTDSRLKLTELLGIEGPGTTIGNHGQRPEGFFYLREDPLNPQLFFMIAAREFGGHGGGCIMTLRGAPSLQPAGMAVTYITKPETTCDPEGEALYRSPVPTRAGELWATVSTVTGVSGGENGAAPPRYNYRLVKMMKQGAYFQPGAPLTSGITRNLNGTTETLWEMDAVEVAPRPKPAPRLMDPVATPEQLAFNQAGVSVDELTSFMKANNLALIVSRNVTQRNRGDRQQPYNLKVRDGDAISVADDLKAGTFDVTDISHLQLFSAQQLRGQDFSNVYFDGSSPDNDTYRRVMAQPWTFPEVNGHPVNPVEEDVARGTIKIARDGSVAAFVPAKRAMTWQLIDKASPGVPKLRTDGIVRERVWVGFQPGEIRSCVACHGGNAADKTQTARVVDGKKVIDTLGDIKNTPRALVDLLTYYKANLKQQN
jgi:hypothetical protein